MRLSRALANVAKGQPSQDLALLSKLNLGQCIRLVRFLGAYGTWNGQKTPQKIHNLDQLSVSWPISSYGAEVLCNWPTAMSTLLNKLRVLGSEEGGVRLGRAFGGFYSALYKTFDSPEFAFLRSAFEGYIAERWTGSVTKRNRRLDVSIMDALAWIPANHACRELQISRRRLEQLIDDGRLQGERHVTSSGRVFITVRKADVIMNTRSMVGNVTLIDAAARLGLKRKRLLSLLPIICPYAEKKGAFGCPWSIPSSWVTYWEQLLLKQQPQSYCDMSCVTLDHLLRYWPWTDEQIGQILVDIAAGRVTSKGVLSGLRGIGALLLNIAEARQWFIDHQKVQSGELTVPEAAIKLDVKQEVLYALIRAGLLVATARRVGRRSSWRLSSVSIQQFQDKYVLGRDVANRVNRSPRAVVAFLASEGIAPIAGPGVNTCRQLVYLRDAVEDCLRQKEVAQRVSQS